MNPRPKIRRGMLDGELMVISLVADAGPRGYWHGRLMQLSSQNAWSRLCKRGLLVEVRDTGNMHLARTRSETRRAIWRAYPDVVREVARRTLAGEAQS